jgi:hypothetical protein
VSKDSPLEIDQVVLLDEMGMRIPAIRGQNTSSEKFLSSSNYPEQGSRSDDDIAQAYLAIEGMRLLQK